MQVIKTKHTFSGSNGEKEVDSLEQFEHTVLARASRDSPLELQGYTFTDIDFTGSRVTRGEWEEALNFKGSVFYGCTLPAFESECEVINKGAMFLKQPEGIPFKMFRSSMYSQQVRGRVATSTHLAAGAAEVRRRHLLLLPRAARPQLLPATAHPRPLRDGCLVRLPRRCACVVLSVWASVSCPLTHLRMCREDGGGRHGRAPARASLAGLPRGG